MRPVAHTQQKLTQVPAPFPWDNKGGGDQYCTKIVINLTPIKTECGPGLVLRIKNTFLKHLKTIFSEFKVMKLTTDVWFNVWGHQLCAP